MRRFVRFLTVTYLWILLTPYLFILLGNVSNQAVFSANNDMFPVRENAVKLLADLKADPDLVQLNLNMRESDPNAPIMLDDRHCLMSDKTHLNWLGDIFDFHTDIVSIGDMLVNFGYWLQSFCPYLFAAFAIRRLVDNNGIWTSEDE
jgi:hypothetical protein